MSWLVPSVGDDDKGAVGHDSRAPAGLDQGRRVGLLDNRGTANFKTGHDRRPVIDIGRDELVGFSGENEARALACLVVRVIDFWVCGCCRCGSADGAAVDAAEIDDAGRTLGAVAVDAVMRCEEVPVERLERVGTGVKGYL